MSEKLTKEQQEELQKIADEITNTAKDLVEDYAKNPSKISGSFIEIHENSPILDKDKEGEPLYSGSRWTKVIKTNI